MKLDELRSLTHKAAHAYSIVAQELLHNSSQSDETRAVLLAQSRQDEEAAAKECRAVFTEQARVFEDQRARAGQVVEFVRDVRIQAHRVLELAALEYVEPPETLLGQALTSATASSVAKSLSAAHEAYAALQLAMLELAAALVRDEEVERAEEVLAAVSTDKTISWPADIRESLTRAHIEVAHGLLQHGEWIQARLRLEAALDHSPHDVEATTLHYLSRLWEERSVASVDSPALGSKPDTYLPVPDQTRQIAPGAPLMTDLVSQHTPLRWSLSGGQKVFQYAGTSRVTWRPRWIADNTLQWIEGDPGSTSKDGLPQVKRLDLQAGMVRTISSDRARVRDAVVQGDATIAAGTKVEMQRSLSQEMDRSYIVYELNSEKVLLQAVAPNGRCQYKVLDVTLAPNGDYLHVWFHSPEQGCRYHLHHVIRMSDRCNVLELGSDGQSCMFVQIGGSGKPPGLLAVDQRTHDGQVFSLPSGALLHGIRDLGSGVAVCCGGRCLRYGTSDGIRAIDVNSGRLVWEQSGHRPVRVLSGAFDAPLICVMYVGGTQVQIWHVTSTGFHPVWEVEYDATKLYWTALSDDGSLLACGGIGEVAVWGVAY